MIYATIHLSALRPAPIRTLIRKEGRLVTQWILSGVRVKTSRSGPERTHLESELPERGFPSGAGTPSVVLLTLLLSLACLCVIQLRITDSGTVPDAVVESQRHLVDGMARSVGATASQSVIDLRTAVALPATASERGPEDLLTALMQSHPKWRGMLLLDGATRKQVAARGEPISVDTVPTDVTGSTITSVVQPAGELRMLATVKVPGQGERLLVASSAAELPTSPLDEKLQQGLLLLNRDGRTMGSRGAVPAPGDKAVRTLLDHAAGSHQAGSVVSGSSVQRATVVTYSPVTSEGLSGTTLGLSVVSVVQVPLTDATSRWPGLLPASVLAVIALLGFALIRVSLVRPLLHLRADALAVASGNLARRVRLSHSSEPRRIALAVRRCRDELRGVRPTSVPRGARFSSSVAVLLAATGVLAWSAGVAVTIGRHDAAVPESVVSGNRSQVDTTAETVRRSLNDGLTDLRAVASLSGATEPAALRPAVEQLAARQDRYRSVYVIDSSGAAMVSAGRPPLRAASAQGTGEGIRLQDTNSRVPVLFAHVPLPAGKHTLIAEYDVEHLSSLLRRAPGRVRVVDSALRTVAANHGYVAFEALAGEPLRGSATSARAGKATAGVHEIGGSGSVVAAKAIDGPGAASALGWIVVSEQPASDLDLVANTEQRSALLVALIGVILALLLFGWHHLILVRPLRRVAAAAEQLAGGDTKSAIYPQRQDQIGTIACCLEIYRQALVDGVGRLGTARRPRGAATDVTVLMDPVPATPEVEPVGRHARRHPNRWRAEV